MIDGINFIEVPNENFWSLPKIYSSNKHEKISELLLSGDYLCSIKKDGHNFRFIKDEDGNMILHGRTKSTVTKNYLNKIGHVPHIQSFFDSIPNGTVLLGELFFNENSRSKRVTTIMGCKEDKAIERQSKGEKLCYYVFDVLAYNNHSLLKTTFSERIKILKTIKEKHGENSWAQFPIYHSGKHALNLLYSALMDGEEGVVLTKKDSIPEPGKRTAWKTIKVKREIAEDIDCFFTGKYKESTRLYGGKNIDDWKYWESEKTGEKQEGLLFNKYYDGVPLVPVGKGYFFGYAGALEIGVYKKDNDRRIITPIGYLSGVTEEFKKQIVSSPSEIALKPIRVSAMEVDLSTGGIRHAIFKEFRDDIPIEDCTWEKIFE